MLGSADHHPAIGVPERSVDHSSRSGILYRLYPRRGAVLPPLPSAQPSGAGALAASRPSWLESILKQNPDRPISLAPSVAEEVFLHLAMNLDPHCAPDMPQILILTGAFGIGKTVSLNETLDRAGCNLIRLHAAEMESAHAGVPAQRILTAYAKASAYQGKTDQPHALVMEDIHLAFGIDGNTTKTVNTQLAVAALMDICDDCANVAGQRTERIPIFATANDLSNVYGGLLRPGRTRVFSIEISPADRQRIVAHMFRGLLTPRQAECLCDARPNWSMAAFRQLKSYLARRSFQRRHAGRTAQELLCSLLTQARTVTVGAAAAPPVAEEDLQQAVGAIDGEADAKRDFTSNVVESDPVHGRGVCASKGA